MGDCRASARVPAIHSGLMFLARIGFAHFSVSFCNSDASSSGVESRLRPGMEELLA
jgi:hypothetical protein